MFYLLFQVYLTPLSVDDCFLVIHKLGYKDSRAVHLHQATDVTTLTLLAEQIPLWPNPAAKWVDRDIVKYLIQPVSSGLPVWWWEFSTVPSVYDFANVLIMSEMQRTLEELQNVMRHWQIMQTYGNIVSSKYLSNFTHPLLYHVFVCLFLFIFRQTSGLVGS